MAVELATAYISLVPSMRGFSSQVSRELNGPMVSAGDEASSKFSKRFTSGISSGMKKAAKVGAVAFAGGFVAAAAGAKVAIEAASGLDEAQSKVTQVFKGQSKEIEAWAATSATAFGQSKQQALEAAGTYGNLFQAFGLGEDQAASMSTSLTELAADLASFNNTSVDEALEALRSGVSGETEPLKRYGVAINDLRLREEALAQGLKVGKGPLDARTKALASYGLIMKDTSLAQGDFERTSDGLANKQRIVSARFKDLAASAGKALLPVAEKIAGVLADDVAPALEKYIPKAVAAAQRAFKSAQPFLDRAGEIFREVAATVAANWPKMEQTVTTVLDTVRAYVDYVLTALTALWRTFGDDILSLVRRAFEPVQMVIRGVLNVVQGVIKTVTGIIAGDWSRAWEGVQQIFRGVWSAIQGIVRAALEVVRTLMAVAWQVIRGVLQRAWDGMKTAVSNAINGIVGFVRALPGRAVSALGNIGATLVSKGRALIEGMRNGVVAGWEALRSFVAGIPGRLVSAIPNPLGILANIGRQVIEGLWNGIAERIDWLKRKLNGLVELDIAGTVAKKLKVKSPSRVFMEIGRYIGDGLVIGIDGSRRDVRRASSGLATAAVVDIAPAWAMRGTSVPASAPAAAPAAAVGRTGPAVEFSGPVVLQDEVDVDLLDRKLTFAMQGAGL